MIGFLKIISYFVNALPLVCTQTLANVLGWFFFHGLRFRRSVVESNLKLAFGKEKSPTELQKIALLNYQHYGHLFFEVLRSITWTLEDYKKHIIFEGLENVQANLKKGKGGIFLANHLGNWEYAIPAAVCNGLKVDVVVKKSRSPLGEKFLNWYRKRFGVGVFLETNTAKDIIRSLAQGRFMTFVYDQFMGPPIGLPVTFFGHRAGTAVALALFSERRDTSIFPAYNYRDESGRCHTVIEPEVVYPELSLNKDTRLFQKTQLYNDILEKIVRRHPEQWLWLHRRWKDYRGEPRWKANPTIASTIATLFLLFFASCASKETTPTGIALPADPTIAAPEFKAALPEENKAEVSVVAEGTITEKIKPTIIEHSTVREKKAKKILPKPTEKPEVPKVTPAVPTSIPIAVPRKGFHVIPSEKIPFEVGEKLEVDLKWLAIPAGKAVLEVKEGPVMNGRPTFHLWGNALSSRIVDAVYHVDNTAESFIDREGLIPYKFLLHMVETQQKKETRVAFDHANGKAYYWAKRLSQRWGDQNIDRVDTLIPQAADLWSAIYYARYLNYKLNEKQSFPVYENGQNWDVELIPVANELVTSGVGAFQCWKIQVKVSLNNVFKPMGDVFLWLSDDSKKYLVKFDAKIKIGSLYGVLTSIKEH